MRRNALLANLSRNLLHRALAMCKSGHRQLPPTCNLATYARDAGFRPTAAHSARLRDHKRRCGRFAGGPAGRSCGRARARPCKKRLSVERGGACGVPAGPAASGQGACASRARQRPPARWRKCLGCPGFFKHPTRGTRATHTCIARNSTQGKWKDISRHFVPSRTPTQVASHAQKHFMRVSGKLRRKSRFTSIEAQQVRKSSDGGARSR